MVFKCINNLAPDYLENKFRFCSCIHDWQTHSASTLDIPFCHLSTGQKSTEEQNCGTHQAVILSLKNVPRNLSANLLGCSQVNLIVLYFYSSDIYIQEVCKSIFAQNSAQYVEAEQNKYYERKKGRNYISHFKPLKSEAIHETGLSGNVVTSFFPLIIFIYIYLAVTIVLYSLIFVLFLLIICIAAEKPIQGASIKICICDYLY